MIVIVHKSTFMAGPFWIHNPISSMAVMNLCAYGVGVTTETHSWRRPGYIRDVLRLPYSLYHLTANFKGIKLTCSISNLSMS